MIIFIKIFIIINLLYSKIILFYKNLYSFIKCEKEYKNIENFLMISADLKRYRKHNKNKINSPKISIISPLFNNQRYLLRFLINIKHQNFYNIEIILIDDSSKDDSKKLIEKYQKEDERIILIKNKKNKGIFVSRNLGVLFTKGKYIIIPDPDDIIGRNILKFCYKIAEKYNLEMIRFNRYYGDNKVGFKDYIKDRIIYQPEISTHLYYENNKIQIIDLWITNKFIKKEAYIRALDSLKKSFLDLFITYAEDVMMNYILYRIIKSFCQTKKIGYYYLKNTMSISHTLYTRTNLKNKFSMIVLKFIFDNSKNTNKEKYMSQSFFFSVIKLINFHDNLSIK